MLGKKQFFSNSVFFKWKKRKERKKHVFFMFFSFYSFFSLKIQFSVKIKFSMLWKDVKMVKYSFYTNELTKYWESETLKTHLQVQLTVTIYICFEMYQIMQNLFFNIPKLSHLTIYQYIALFVSLKWSVLRPSYTNIDFSGNRGDIYFYYQIAN